jgi:hypothetical protein
VKSSLFCCIGDRVLELPLPLGNGFDIGDHVLELPLPLGNRFDIENRNGL